VTARARARAAVPARRELVTAKCQWGPRPNTTDFRGFGPIGVRLTFRVVSILLGGLLTGL